MKYVIEKMTVNDIHSVQQVATESWNHTYKGIIPLDVQNNFLRAAYSTEMLKKTDGRVGVVGSPRRN